MDTLPTPKTSLTTSRNVDNNIPKFGFNYDIYPAQPAHRKMMDDRIIRVTIVMDDASRRVTMMMDDASRRVTMMMDDASRRISPVMDDENYRISPVMAEANQQKLEFLLNLT